MNKTEQRFIDSLRQITKSSPVLKIATVKEINDDGSVLVNIDDSSLDLEAKIKADIAKGVGVEVVPVIGSKVLVSHIEGNKGNAIILAFSLIEDLSITTEKDIKINAGNDCDVEIEGKCNINVSGQASISATKIKLNTGLLGGLVQVTPMTLTLVQLHLAIVELQTLMATHIHNISGSPKDSNQPPDVIFSAFAPKLMTELPIKTNYENLNVTHG